LETTACPAIDWLIGISSAVDSACAAAASWSMVGMFVP
jgi:hypothetical protein